MKEKDLYILLNTVKKNGDLKRFAREGISYVEVAMLTNEAIAVGLIVYHDEKIVLSNEGEKTYERIKVNYRKINKEDWIQKDRRNMVARIGKNTIFVPRQDELTF